MKTRLFLISTFSCLLFGCQPAEEDKVGTLIFTANGEDFVRDGFISEDGWSISFNNVYVNIDSPTAYQVVENTTNSALRHGGHPHGEIPEGSAHVSLLGEYFLQLKQDVFEFGRMDNASIGNYNRLSFNIKKSTSDSDEIVSSYIGFSIILEGTAIKEDNTISFSVKFDEEMEYFDCGPNGLLGVLAENAQATAELTFHFDHIFGDIEEGPANPEDINAINYIAIGFQPFADLATDGNLDIDQETLSQQMAQATYQQLIEAIQTLGHSGEGHCILELDAN
jgi:hypothetical protein